MFSTLRDFYHSREWQDFTKSLRLERASTDGSLYCEHCGKPIVKAYDCIAHHKRMLTLENVNDYNVSLNSSNIELVHHACHNEIHARFGFRRQEVFLVWGPPCAGKCDYVERIRQPGDLIVNIDTLWQAVSGCPRYVKPPALRPVVFGVWDHLLDSVRYRQGRWQNAYVIGGFPFAGERERILRDLDARDVFIDTPQGVCLSRAAEDPARDAEEWSGYIADWFERYERTLGML